MLHTREKTYSVPQKEFNTWMRSKETFLSITWKQLQRKHSYCFWYLSCRTKCKCKTKKCSRRHQPESWNSNVRNYVSETGNLRQQQATAGSNSFPYPRSHDIINTLKGRVRRIWNQEFRVVLSSGTKQVFILERTNENDNTVISSLSRSRLFIDQNTKPIVPI